jgi:trans-o-hydroxybenzylidenepyruvate hydratase-aldolase
MLSAADITGVYVMAPTPCKVGADAWEATDSVDLDETAHMVEQFVQDGVGGIAACGTTGECAALLWEEKRDFIDTVVQVSRRRVPVFAGATALGTKEMIRQMRGLKDVGADGAFVGLPLWQTPTLENSVQFFADLSEAVPDMPIMVYSNAMFFKSVFPNEFWDGVARRAPTVVTTKVTYGIEHLLEDMAVAGHQIAFLPGQNEIYPAYKLAGARIRGCWSTSANMGPRPVVALMNAILANDRARGDAIWEDITSMPTLFPEGGRAHFAEYNVQVEKARINASGYINCGPPRAPYRDLPADWAERAEVHGKAWAQLHERYAQEAAG